MTRSNGGDPRVRGRRECIEMVALNARNVLRTRKATLRSWPAQSRTKGRRTVYSWSPRATLDEPRRQQVLLGVRMPAQEPRHNAKVSLVSSSQQSLELNDPADLDARGEARDQLARVLLV